MDGSRVIVVNNLSDAITIFDIDIRGELRASDQVTVRRPAFIAPFLASIVRVSQRTD
jgi:hypothetical protein